MKNRRSIFLFSLCVFVFYGSAALAEPITIMLDPAGNAGNTGRKLSDGYERAETLRFAETLAQKLEEKLSVKVVLSRSPGEGIASLQTASFANRLNVDLFIRLSLYKEESLKPKMYLYHLVYNPILDRTSFTEHQPSFTSIHQAHYKSNHSIKVIGNTIKASLIQPDNQRLFDFYGPFGISIKPLVGIMSPAILLEVGINRDSGWESLVEPLVEGLRFITG